MSSPAQAVRPEARRVSERQLAARRVVIPCEDPVAYHDIRGDLLSYWNPVGAQEMMLVDQIAQSFWRIRRAWAVETEILDLEIGQRPQ